MPLPIFVPGPGVCRRARKRGSEPGLLRASPSARRQAHSGQGGAEGGRVLKVPGTIIAQLATSCDNKSGLSKALLFLHVTQEVARKISP